MLSYITIPIGSYYEMCNLFDAMQIKFMVSRASGGTDPANASARGTVKEFCGRP
jgi:hypothetical protein